MYILMINKAIKCSLDYFFLDKKFRTYGLFEMLFIKILKPNLNTQADSMKFFV